MGKRINWIKMNQIKTSYEEGLACFQEKIEKHKEDFCSKESLDKLKELERGLKNTLTSLNNYKSLTMYHIEKDGYVLPKTLLSYFDEKEQVTIILKEELHDVLSKVQTKINLKIRDGEEVIAIHQRKNYSNFQIKNNPCPNITKKEKLKRFFKISHYRCIQLAFWAIIVAFLISIITMFASREKSDSTLDFFKKDIKTIEELSNKSKNK